MTANHILAAEKRWTQAHEENNFTALADLMDEDYQRIDDKGNLLNKTETLATYTPDSRFWDEAESDQYTVQIFGDTAILTGRWRARGVNNGQHFDYAARFVTVYINRSADPTDWKLLFEQSTPVPR